MFQYIIRYFYPEILFNMQPGSLECLVLKILIVTFCIIIVLGIIAGFLTKAKTNDKMLARGLKRVKNAFLTIGIIGYVYIFFANQGAKILSARFWFPLLLVILLFWLSYPIRYIIFKLPKLREEIKKRKEFEKYLP